MGRITNGGGGGGGWGQGMAETKSMGGGEVVGKMVGEMRVVGKMRLGEVLQAQEKDWVSKCYILNVTSFKSGG